MGRRLKHQFDNSIYLRSIKSCPINFSFWDHFSEQLSTRRSWPAFETVLLHLKQKCPLSFVQPPPPLSPPLKIPKQKHCYVFLETSSAISFFFSLFSYLSNNRDLYQLPLDVFDGVPLSYLWVFIQTLSRKVVGKSARENAERYSGCSPKKFDRMEREAMDVCLRVLKESNKSRFDSCSRQEECIDYIPLPFGIVPCTFFRQPFSK